MQANQSAVIFTIAVATIILLIAGFFMVSSIKDTIPEAPIIIVPTADEIAVSVLAGITIPTVADIAGEIEMPDTLLSVRDDKKDIAESLATNALTDRDFREWISNRLNSVLFTDLDKNDIVLTEVRDLEVNLLFRDKARVEITAKIIVDDDGDQEEVKVDFTVIVTDLDRDDDYDDAEVDEDSYDGFNLVRCYDNYC